MINHLPKRIMLELNKQKVSIRPRPYIIIKNSPTDKKVFFSPDPDIYTPSAKSGNISENFLTGITPLI